MNELSVPTEGYLRNLRKWAWEQTHNPVKALELVEFIVSGQWPPAEVPLGPISRSYVQQPLSVDLPNGDGLVQPV